MDKLQFQEGMHMHLASVSPLVSIYTPIIAFTQYLGYTKVDIVKSIKLAYVFQRLMKV